jgi:hypothetical protein
MTNLLRRLQDLLDRKIIESQTCPGCGCNADQWREDCGCTRHDCECSRILGPDTDFDDTFDYQHPDGAAPPVSGKWWLRGKCSIGCADVNCPPNGPCQREERFKADQLPPVSFSWLDGELAGDRANPAPADEEVKRLSEAVDAAFRARDEFWDLWQETGHDEDKQAMEAWDRQADRLLTEYNAVCQAQYAESDRQRAENLARYVRDQAVTEEPSDGSWTERRCLCGSPYALDPNDRIHIDEGDGGAMISLVCARPGCSVQSVHYWAASDEEYEREFGHAYGMDRDADGNWIPDDCRECGAPLDEATNTTCTRCGENAYEETDGPDATTGADFAMPPAAQPYQPPAKADASAPRDTTESAEQGATDMNSKQMTGQSQWDRFYAWFDSLWRWPAGDTEPAPLPQGSQGRTSAALALQANQDAAKSQQDTSDDAATDGSKEPGWVWIPQLDGGCYNPKPDLSNATLDTPPAADPYRRASTQPQDLDAITAGVAPPPADNNVPQLNTNLKVDFDPDWCTCEGIAHNATCGLSKTGLNVGGMLPPPPAPSPYAAPPEPAPSNQP